MDDHITIIEGPPPVFEHVNENWALGLNEGPNLFIPALTRLRTFNGAELVERCYRAWHEQASIHLHFRNESGTEQTAPILAARNVQTQDGDMLMLWIYLDRDHVEYEVDSNDDENAEDNPE